LYQHHWFARFFAISKSAFMREPIEHYLFKIFETCNKTTVKTGKKIDVVKISASAIRYQ